VIDHLPKKEWPAARELLRKISYAENQATCERLRDRFVARYRTRYPKATETLCRDWERMVAFYRFPKPHWRHLRTSNVVESPFSVVRLRTGAARRYKRSASVEAVIWKILMIGEKTFHRLNALEAVYAGKEFVNGVAVDVTQRRLAA